MQLRFVPVLAQGGLTVSVRGDVVTINGADYDFTPMPEGGQLPLGSIPSEHFAGPVERIGGELYLVLRLPHGSNPPAHVAFPDPIHVSVDGVVTLPTDGGGT